MLRRRAVHVPKDKDSSVELRPLFDFRRSAPRMIIFEEAAAVPRQVWDSIQTPLVRPKIDR